MGIRVFVCDWIHVSMDVCVFLKGRERVAHRYHVNKWLCVCVWEREREREPIACLRDSGKVRAAAAIAAVAVFPIYVRIFEKVPLCCFEVQLPNWRSRKELCRRRRRRRWRRRRWRWLRLLLLRCGLAPFLPSLKLSLCLFPFSLLLSHFLLIDLFPSFHFLSSLHIYLLSLILYQSTYLSLSICNFYSLYLSLYLSI